MATPAACMRPPLVLLAIRRAGIFAMWLTGCLDYVVADCDPCVPVAVAREDLAVILDKKATTGGNAKHHLPIARKSNAPAAAPRAKPATAAPMRRNRDLMASRATLGTPRIISAISIII